MIHGGTLNIGTSSQVESKASDHHRHDDSCRKVHLWWQREAEGSREQSHPLNASTPCQSGDSSAHKSGFMKHCKDTLCDLMWVAKVYELTKGA